MYDQTHSSCYITSFEPCLLHPIISLSVPDHWIVLKNNEKFIFVSVGRRKVYKISKYFTMYSSFTEIHFYLSRHLWVFQKEVSHCASRPSLLVITSVHWFYDYPENSFHSSRDEPVTRWGFCLIQLCNRSLYLHSLLTPSKCSSSLLTASTFHSFTVISLIFGFSCFKHNAC